MDIRTDEIPKSFLVKKEDSNLREELDKAKILRKKYSIYTSTNVDCNEEISGSDNQEYREILEVILSEETPLIYLNKNQKDAIISSCFYTKILENDVTLYKCVDDIHTISAKRKNTNGIDLTKDSTFKYEDTNLKEVSHLINLSECKYPNECFILLKGEIHCFDSSNKFTEHLTPGSCFGYNGPLFNKREQTCLATSGSILCVITQELFLSVIEPFSKFSNYIQRTIIYKDSHFIALDKFKEKVLSYTNEGPIDFDKLLNLFHKIDSCLNPYGKNINKIDFSGWNYAVERLPPGLMNTFVYNLVNASTKYISMDKDVFFSYVEVKESKARNRTIFNYLPGKDIIVCRDMETDVLDFVSNMCIHVSECKKMRNLISNPSTYRALFDAGDDDELCLKIIEENYGPLSNEDKKNIKHIFGKGLSSKLIKMTFHFQDYNISIKNKQISRKDPEQLWIQNIWSNVKQILGVKTSSDEVEDLIVDLSQGSHTTLMSLISPYLYENKDRILNYCKEKNIQFKTQKFLNPNDELIAASYYYFLDFPDEKIVRNQMDKDSGIISINETFSTGVKVLIINVNKLNPEKCDPSVKIKPASKNHIIVHIGYTFGAQSTAIMKPLLMLFGEKSRSFNIIGKAGALVGNRTDILIADRMFHDKTHDLIKINTGSIEVEELKQQAGTDVHLGPMLCVAGTILQNNDLLRFYKYVNGCVGLEMEGFYYVHEIDKAMKGGMISKDFLTRCFYYSSDLPLDPTQNLSMEGGNISWEEGVGSILAIQRYILNQYFK